MRLAMLAVLLLASSRVAATESAAKAGAAPASNAATVVCTIRSPGEDGKTQVDLDGPCRFLPEGKRGSFSLSALDGQQPLFEGILVLSVTVVAPGKAEVRGVTAEGINSRWGEARRSKADPACWTGSDFEICARRKE
ncbi:MAG TPA: hypothetical protein VFL83_09910 [Anaeromyxobacter sp.]|nr:hypothetical protein [Anaeromyxobacter sp.]